MTYNCRHFTRAWCDSFGSAGKITKGEAGEVMTYRALQQMARAEHVDQPVLLGEPSPVDLAILADTHRYPDCYFRLDEREYLFEARNVCYSHDIKKSWNAHGFWQQSLGWVKKGPLNKAWTEDKYPIRGTRRTTTGNKTVWQWVYVYSKRNIMPVYVSTVPSFNVNARGVLDAFFGPREVFVDHPINNRVVYPGQKGNGLRALMVEFMPM